MKGRRAEGIKEAKKEYKYLLNEGLKKKLSSKATYKVFSKVKNSKKIKFLKEKYYGCYPYC